MAKKEARASPMLTGRESLIRVIGKRRRVLPNRQSLFPAIPEEIPSLSHSQIHHLPKEENATQIDSKAPHKAGGDQVTCPVCGDAVHGSDYTLNSHLDLCLVRGTKRKLKQRTLLQFNFCSNSLSKDNINLRQQEADELLTLPDDNNTINNKNDSSLPELDAVGGNSPPSSRLGSETREELSVEKLISNKEVDTSSEVDTGNSIDDTSMRILNTFIVGRKFSEADLNQGDEISLLRDPHNVKDPNAIKVVSMDSKCPKVLGFLPRELARCLSPLIDKYNLIFQQRSATKVTFPLVWTNTCCSHPLYRDSELIEENYLGVRNAAQRKLLDEIGIPAEDVPVDEFKPIGRILYKAPSDGKWGEHELDYLLFIVRDVQFQPNPDEVADAKYVNREELKEILRKADAGEDGLKLSPWFRLVVDNFLFKWWDHVQNGTLEEVMDMKTIHKLT